MKLLTLQNMAANIHLTRLELPGKLILVLQYHNTVSKGISGTGAETDQRLKELD